MNMKRLKPDIFRTLVLLGFTIPLVWSGSYLYRYFNQNNDISSAQATDATGQMGAPELVAGEDYETADAATALNTEIDSTSSDVILNTADSEVSDAEDEVVSSAEAQTENEATESIALSEITIKSKPYAMNDIKKLETSYQTLFFDAQSFKISSVDQAQLDAFAALALEFADEAIAIEGHANGYPNFENSILEQTLSGDRAEAVSAYLESLGISSSRISIYNCGSSEPIAVDVNDQAQNDRVEVYFVDYNAKGIKDK